MRILIIIPSINHITGGPSKSGLDLAASLAALGHEVEMYTTNWPDCSGPLHVRREERGVSIHLFRASQIPGLRHVPYSRELLATVRSEYRRFGLFVCNSLWNPLISHATAFLRLRGVPYAISPHGMMDPLVFERNSFRKYCWSLLCEKRNVEQAQLLIFNSATEEKKARRRGWNLRRTIVIPHSVDITAGERLPPRGQLEFKYPQLKDKHLIAFVGRINWVKNLEHLIRSVAHLRSKKMNVALLCAGPDSDGHRAELEILAEELAIQDEVIFTGMLESEELSAVYARADVAALVSQKENFGLAAADALASGVPVVLSDGVDMGEHWPCPPVWRVKQDVGSIAIGLEDALLYSESQGVPARAALQLASQEWSISHCAELVASFESILAMI
jgi:glycosyltransferase involved in cell wall biosynthesis